MFIGCVLDHKLIVVQKLSEILVSHYDKLLVNEGRNALIISFINGITVI